MEMPEMDRKNKEVARLKIFKKILAGILAVNLTVGVIPGSALQASAESWSNTVYHTAETELSNSSIGENGTEESTAENTEQTETDATSASTETDQSQEEPTGEAQDQPETSEDSSVSPETETEPENDISVQAAGTLDVTQFAHYTDTSGAKSIEIQSAEELILLSNCKAADLQNITIKINMTGGIIDLTGNIQAGAPISGIISGMERADQEYSFQGIGSEDAPFQGKIEGQSLLIQIDRPFFGGLSSKAVIERTGNTEKQTLVWNGDGSVPMIAQVYQFESESTDGFTLPVKVTKGSRSSAMGSLLGTVQATDGYAGQILKITDEEVNYTGASVSITSTIGNAGLICNTLKNGTICLDGFRFPDSVEIKTTAKYDSAEENRSAAGNAGGLIGVMETGTKLQVNAGITLNSVSVTSDNGNAGGLVGLIQSGAEIVTGTSAEVILKTPQVSGGAAAGGVAGAAEDIAFAEDELASVITVDDPTVTGRENGASAGGFIGNYTLSGDKVGTAVTFPEQIGLQNPTLIVDQRGTGFAGGYFGTLELNSTITYSITGTDNASKELSVTFQNCSAEACGAIAGKVSASTIEAALMIQNVKTKTNNQNSAGSKYHGGLIGELGSGTDTTDTTKPVYLEVSNTEIHVENPLVSEGNNTYGFGGAVGFLAQGSILKTTDTITVSTSGSAINQGGGLVGYAEKSVLSLSGTTDLSGTVYQEGRGKSAQTGWLVGRQESALIYAAGDGNGQGWTYIRGKENTTGKTAENDIGNYGQIIRLKSENSKSKLSEQLITIDTNHNVSYSEGLDATGNITINSENKFALLSIAWNTRGYFGGVTGISADKFSTAELQSKTINLSADIDLTGSGITSLTRDTNTNEDTFQGTFDGDGKTITLAIGETFGFKQDNKTTLASEGEDGYGEVIAADGNSHNRQGLFAKTAAATINKLTVGGTIWVSGAGKDILAGGIAGDSSGDTVHKTVSVNETIYADCENNQVIAVGGFYGGCYGGQPQFGTYTDRRSGDQNQASAKIYLQNCKNTDETKIYAGGLIGEANNMGKLMAYSVTVGGSIYTEETETAYVGGLVGVIRNGSSWNEPVQNEVATNDRMGRVWIEIKGVTFDGFKIDAPKVTEICGGLFGSIWRNVGLYFMGTNDRDDDSGVKLEVKDAEINAPNVKYVGGLAYRSCGIWEIREYGIDLKKLTINAKENVGLLVCRGEKGTENISGNNVECGALYLCTTKYWDTEATSFSYRISEDDVKVQTNNNGVFDEFVAYTSKSASGITENGINGVVSIATKEEGGKRVGVDKNGCTSYQNRTAYGKTHKTNACSRYYYDLDQCQNDMAGNTNSVIDTPEELLLWSVYNYACENLRFDLRTERVYKKKITDIFTPSDGGTWIIGTKELDMEGYSYYPINYGNASVTIKDTTITFYNKEIEETETKAADQKSTQVTANSHTQHYTMHCGLFLDYQISPVMDKTTSTTTVSNATLEVNNVTFAGTVGKVENGDNSTSGVLIARAATGCRDTSNNIGTLTISVNTMILNNLSITDYQGEKVSPLFINQINEYLTLNVNGLTTRGEDNTNTYTEGTAVASSLIGHAGSKSAKQINLTFLNVVLPDKKAEGTSGIFSHATLLESYAYAEDDTTSNATYNFYSDEDWTGTTHVHKVTYGKEIQGTTEFKDLQKWYYDESTYGSNDGLVYDENGKPIDSSIYLPYVCVSYDESKNTHEIKVNQRVQDILNGCGTYGHPYEITSEKELEILAEYMSTGTPRKDWMVTITGNQSAYHSSSNSNDVTYQYNGSKWVQVENSTGKWLAAAGKDQLDRDFMLQYLLNAYYDLKGSEDSASFELENFIGFGTSSNPFRGVLTSSNTGGVTIKLNGSNTANGLIPYSAGCVVRNLTLVYGNTGDTGKKLTYDTAAAARTNYYPQVCFGGVIGCVLGGDNIIESVTVSIETNWLTIDGDKKHLIQIGGYVGSVSGGGVIFRNMTDGIGLTAYAIKDVDDITTDTDSTAANLYINPYVGRVMDGFAFYEKTKSDNNITSSLDNTNKNYTINTLEEHTTEACVSANGTTVTVKDAQGLLVLSAVINSGAASGGGSSAYSSQLNSQNRTTESTNGMVDDSISYSFGGSYGKVRRAAYDEIGASVGTEEVKLSMEDDQNAPGEGNLPYLIQKYCGNQAGVFKISNAQGTINLAADGSLDMTGYGNGYQGLGGRYVSNAEQKIENGNAADYPEGIVPELAAFNGNNCTVTMEMKVKEYADDDFHAASVGGLFNILRIVDGKKVNDSNALTIGSNNKRTIVSLSYYNSTGTAQEASTDWNNRKEVGVGGFAGSLVGYTDNDESYDITVSGIRIDNLTVSSPASAGGVFGNTGKQAAGKNRDIAILLQPKDEQIVYGIKFDKCRYSDSAITGRNSAGGFVGYIGNANQNPRAYVNGFENEGDITGENSEIAATETGSDSWAGGLFGYVGTRLFVNMTDDGTESETKTILQDVSVSAGNAAGGCIGWIEKDNKDKDKNKQGSCYGIHNVTVKAVNKTALTNGLISLTGEPGTNSNIKTFYAGGIIGYARGAEQNWDGNNWHNAGWVSNSTVENVRINDETQASNAQDPGWGAIWTNYMVGGLIGYTTGGVTKLNTCMVKSGKIYGSAVGGGVGQTDTELWFTDCKIKGASKSSPGTVKGFSTAGGFLGFWKNRGVRITIQGCELQYMELEGKDWGSGALVGDAESASYGNETLYIFDTSVRDSSVKAAGNEGSAGGRWPSVGGVTGNLRNSIKASNLLFSGVTLTGEKGSYSEVTKGLLFGAAIGDPSINIAGISIQGIPDSNSGWELTGSGSVTTDNDYIAFADYSGTAPEEDESTGLMDAIPMAPYVVTNPKSTLVLPDSADENAENKVLYGDGVSWTKIGNGDSAKFTVMAETIWKNRDKVTDKHYGYTNITNEKLTGITDKNFDPSTLIATYNENQQTKVDDSINFPVLQISNGNADAVGQYLDVLTNGGFSAANKMSKVTAKAIAYQYENEAFKNTGREISLKVVTAANGKISFQTTAEYDNDQNRFTLLEVTFTEKDSSNKAHEYHVFVPVLVRRMLEMNFTATLTYGTDFRSLDYAGLDHHVLESFGSSITGYLTYTYDSDENGSYADYGWQSYINGGGDLTEMTKSLKFVMVARSFPSGTQMTLVDAKSGKSYYYTANGQEDYTVDGVVIPYTSFVDSDGNAYQEPSISELIGASASTTTGEKLFVKVDKDGKPEKPVETKTYSKPTIRIRNSKGDYEYYRLADSDETPTHSITVDDSSLKKSESGEKTISQITESYFLVITVPEDKTGTVGALNGSVQTVVDSKIPHNVSYRTITGGEDTHSNACSYQLSNGYQQTLEQINSDGLKKLITVNDSGMTVNLRDEITFPDSQAYNEQDQLYLQFSVGLQKVLNGSTSSAQFPRGTSGTVSFYVYAQDDNGSKTYYTYDGGSWEAAGNDVTEPPEAAKYDYSWTGNVDLLLSEDGTAENAISLQGVRGILKDNKIYRFYVEVKTKLTVPTEPITALEVFPESKLDDNGLPVNYVSMNYSSRLSTVKQSLSYSSNRVSAKESQRTRYYRDEPAGAKLTYYADQIDQLGINLLDLRYLDAAKENSLIDTTAYYDLSEMKDMEKTLEDSSGIRFTLTLQQKNPEGETEDYGAVLTAAASYLQVELKSGNYQDFEETNGIWTWTVPQKDYWKDGKLNTADVFDGTKLSQAIQLKVNVSNVENGTGHLYSNYKVVLKAEILDSNGSSVTNTDETDDLIYTLARIKLEFQEKKTSN